MAKAPDHWVATGNVITNPKGGYVNLNKVHTTSGVIMTLNPEDTLTVSHGETTKIDHITGKGKVTIMPGAELHCETYEDTLTVDARNGSVLDGVEVEVAGHTAPDANNA